MVWRRRAGPARPQVRHQLRRPLGHAHARPIAEVPPGRGQAEPVILRQLRRHDAAVDVGRAARRKGDDYSHRSAGIALRERRARDEGLHLDQQWPVAVEHRHHGLRDDRPVVEFGRHEMHAAAVRLDAGF